MKKHLFCLLFLTVSLAFSQKLQHKEGPYGIKNSEPLKIPKKFSSYYPYSFGTDYIYQLNTRDLKAFNFQKFDVDLKFLEEKTIDVSKYFSEDYYYSRTIELQHKNYFLTRSDVREIKAEDIQALEFDPQKMDFVGQPKSILTTTSNIRGDYDLSDRPFGIFGISKSRSGYFEYSTCGNREKFMFTYSLLPTEKKSVKSYEIIGIKVFDENLKFLWGGEFEMPYTEAKMDKLDFKLLNDGRALLLAKVYEGETAKAGRSSDEPNFHFEIFTFDKGQKSARISKIMLDNNFPISAVLYETPSREIGISGSYAHTLYGPVQGAFNVRMDLDKGTLSRTNGGFYEIPIDIMMQYTSKRAQKKVAKKEKKDEDFDLGIRDLKVRTVNLMPDGTTKIISEIFFTRVTSYYDAGCKCTRTTYDTYGQDIYIISIMADGKLEWIKKIPKLQHAPDAFGARLSFNSIIKGNDLHLFYLDNLKNFNLPVDEYPKRLEQSKGGFIMGVTVSPNGDIKKYNLGEANDFKTRFQLRFFQRFSGDRLISSEERKKKIVLYSIEVH